MSYADEDSSSQASSAVSTSIDRYGVLISYESPLGHTRHSVSSNKPH